MYLKKHIPTALALPSSSSKYVLAADTIEQSVQRDGYSCGFHTANTIIKALNPNRSRVGLWQALKTSVDGTTQTNLIRGLRRHGITVTPNYQINWPKIRQSIDLGKMLIVYDNYKDHWFTLGGYFYTESKRKAVIVIDSELGIFGEPYKELRLRTGTFALLCGKRRLSASAARRF